MGFVPIGGLFEGDVHGVTQIRSAIHIGAPSPCTTGARLAKDVAKNIAKDVGEAGSTWTAGTTSHVGINPRMAVPVIGCPLLLV